MAPRRGNAAFFRCDNTKFSGLEIDAGKTSHPGMAWNCPGAVTWHTLRGDYKLLQEAEDSLPAANTFSDSHLNVGVVLQIDVNP